jgi:hypothetical protein
MMLLDDVAIACWQRPNPGGLPVRKLAPQGGGALFHGLFPRKFTQAQNLLPESPRPAAAVGLAATDEDEFVLRVISNLSVVPAHRQACHDDGGALCPRQASYAGVCCRGW